MKKTTALIILDGWGHREDTDNNAIALANTPTWDKLWANYPHTLISGSGEDVGLPDGQMGNSEVGHMSLGAGRIVYQSISRIDKAIKDGDFFDNEAYCKAIDAAVKNHHAVHIMGLLSSGGVHSHEQHLHAMVNLATQRGATQIFVHAFLDGRDTPPRSAKNSITALDKLLRNQQVGCIASIIGRYYAMDRDNRWDRVEKAYRLLTEAQGEYRAKNATDALEMAYQRDENDEFVSATSIPFQDESVAIEDGDALIFMNFRADRAREISRAFTDDNFSGFNRQVRPNCHFVMTTEYADDIAAPCAFPPEKLTNVLGEYLEKNHKTQLRIAETEKYAHVTFFFSGGREALFEGEQRELIASPDVATYDLQPEMSAPEVTKKLVDAIKSGQYDTIICNYANGDMVGHTGNLEAAIKAAEAIDESIKAVTDAIIEADGHCLITADHGNCEQMVDHNSGQAHTAHTCELVPLIYVSNTPAPFIVDNGRLADIAPTLLTLMGMTPPEQMTGRVLLAVN